MRDDMMLPIMSEREIFHAALETADPAERMQYLEAACARDEALKQRILHLLQMHEQLGSFMQSPGAATEAGAVPAGEEPGAVIGPHRLLQKLAEGPGTVIGCYKLLQQIGEGGFGVVYMAEQDRPVQRKVALKIIKPGMDTAQVIARFESERQALALMEHPNIAMVLDAGATVSGRPYFVMELVKGVPITEFCDKNHLSPEARLKPFVDVCHAIQHAHHKGVIHRDIKPSNVMITLHDGVPVVKVIDFGVAKATAQKLTGRRNNYILPRPPPLA
jgi:serine/threonine protein kinase